MADVSLAFREPAQERSTVLEQHGLEPGGYLLATAHRAGNVDDPDNLRLLVELLEDLPLPCVLPLHPRTAARLEAAGLRERLDRPTAGVLVLPPLGYLDFTKLAMNARAILTDSGGVQKEAYLLGVPCVTLRETHRVDGDGGRRLEHAGGPGSGGGAGRAGAPRRRPASAPSCTAAGRRRSGSARSSPPTLLGHDASQRVKVGVVGLGYVGLPLAIAFAEEGHDVVGVDADGAPRGGDRRAARATSRT